MRIDLTWQSIRGIGRRLKKIAVNIRLAKARKTTNNHFIIHRQNSFDYRWMPLQKYGLRIKTSHI